jgi:polygalacturonase
MKKYNLLALVIVLAISGMQNIKADTRIFRDIDILDVYSFNYNASSWVEQANLQKNVSIYGNEMIPVTELPAILEGADFIQTTASSKNFSGKAIVNFTIGEDATLYVIHSVLVKTKPKWLADFKPVEGLVKTAAGDFQILAKSVKKGDKVSLGDNGSKTAPMYFIVAKPEMNAKKILPKGKLFDIKTFGALGDNKTINTKAIQAAIDKCSATKFGGTVYIADGIYISGTLELKDNVTLYVEKGTILRGSLNHEDYPQKISTAVPSFRTDENYQFLFADCKQNIRITGGGIIDGNSLYEGFPWKGKGNENERPRLIRMVKCSKVSVDSVTLMRSGNWTQYYEACNQLTLLDLNIRCYTGTNNQDGMDISGCKNVLVRNIRALAGDDVICIKSLSMEVGENILVENVKSQYANCHLVKIGTETHGGVKNLTVRNVEGTARYGIAIESVDGAAVENILYENILLHSCSTPLFIKLGARGRTFVGGPKPAPQSTMKNITIRNVRNTDIGYVEVRNGPGVGSAIGGSPNQKIENLTIEDCDFLYFGSVMDKEFVYRDVPENDDKYPEFNIYGTCPAYGLYFRHIDGIHLKNVKVRVKNSDVRPAIVYDDAKNIDMKNVNCQSFTFTELSPIWNKSDKK